MSHFKKCIGTTIFSLALIAGCEVASADDAGRSWNLFTQSFGGTVSLLHDLTQHECMFALHRVKGEPATPTLEPKVIPDWVPMLNAILEIHILLVLTFLIEYCKKKISRKRSASSEQS